MRNPAEAPRIGGMLRSIPAMEKAIMRKSAGITRNSSLSAGVGKRKPRATARVRMKAVFL